jgi:uncharacterized protein YgiB involved in biofilm formation
MNQRAILLVAAAALFIAAPVHATTRDDLLKAVNTCMAIAGNAERLACYDALKPQVQAALAETPEQVAKEESSSWFGLDHLFGGKPAPQVEPKQFGSDQLPPAEQAKVMPPEIATIRELDTITATLTDYALTASGHFIVFLDNGQVWQQSEGDSDTIHFRHNPKDNTVSISRGIVGTYDLKLNTANQIYKVRRQK